MNIELLSGGFFTAPAGVWRRGDELDRMVRFPIPVYVIDTGEERILVDAGLHPGAVADPGAHYGAGEALAMFTFELERTLAEQVDVETITQVVVTHMHFDHAGGLATLPASIPIVVQRREWHAGQDREAIARNHYLPLDYEPIADRVTLVDGDHDLFGDGSVRLLLTPGHTPGHQSVLVEDRFVIGGDVVHYASTLDDHRFPMLGDDPDAQTASAERLRELRDAGATVMPGHDPDVLAPGVIALTTG